MSTDKIDSAMQQLKRSISLAQKTIIDAYAESLDLRDEVFAAYPSYKADRTETKVLDSLPKQVDSLGKSADDIAVTLQLLDSYIGNPNKQETSQDRAYLRSLGEPGY